MPLIRLKKATPGNIVLIDFSSKHEIGKSSEKRVNPLRQIVACTQYPLMPQILTTSMIWKLFKIKIKITTRTTTTTTECLLSMRYSKLKSQQEQQQQQPSAYYQCDIQN